MMNFYIKLYSIININRYIDKYKNIISNLGVKIIKNYKKNIINKNNYNIYLTDLEEIYNDLEKMERATIKSKIKMKREELDNIKIKIQKLGRNVGLNNIYEIIFIESNIIGNNFYSNNNIISFLNKTFIPYSYKSISKLDNKIIKYNNDEIIDNEDNEDNEKILKQNKIDTSIKTIKYYELQNVKTLYISVNGSIIYIPIDDNFIILLEGYFIEDPLNNLKKHKIFKKKYLNLEKQIEKLNLDKDFKLAYFNQISLRNFIIYDNIKLVEICVIYFSKVENLKKKNHIIYSKRFFE